MKHLFKWFTGETRIFGITIDNWLLFAAGMFILMLYLSIMSPFKDG